jgi:hypothetical protein
MLFVPLLPFLDDLHVMRQALAGVGIEIDQAVAHAVGLVKPDAVFVIHADVPEGGDQPRGIVGQQQPDPFVLARFGQFALEIPAGNCGSAPRCSSDTPTSCRRGPAPHTSWRTMCAVCRLRSEEVYIILAVSHPGLMLQSAGPLAIQSACEYTIFMATHSAEAASAIDLECPPGRTAFHLGTDYPVPLSRLCGLALIHDTSSRAAGYHPVATFRKRVWPARR